MKKIILFTILGLNASTCLHIEYMFPRAVDYYVDEYDIRIKRTTTNRKSRYEIIRGKVSLGTFFWDNNVPDYYLDPTDCDTRYAIVITRDSVYLDGRGWKKMISKAADPSVVITWKDMPNAYCSVKYVDPLRKQASFTDYYMDIAIVPPPGTYFKLRLMKYPDLEFVKESSPGIRRSIPYNR